MLIYEEVGEFDGGGQVADDRRGDEDQLHFLHYTTQTTVHRIVEEEAGFNLWQFINKQINAP